MFQPRFARAEAQPPFHIIEQWHLSGSAGWGNLYFDGSTKLLYIPRTDRVVVFDTVTGKEEGEVTGFVDARMLAFDNEGRFGYVTDIADGSVGFVRVFNCSTLKLVATIPVGRIPSAVVFDPRTRSVFAFSSRDRNASVIDTRTNRVTATIPLPGKPHIALADGNGTIYAGLRGIGELVRIDAAARAVSAAWPLASCVEFSGLAFDGAHRQLVGSCVNQDVISVNAESGQVAAVGKSADGPGDLAFDPQSRLLISAASSGKLSVFHQDSSGQFVVQDQVPTLPRAGTLAFDPTSERAFVITAKFQQRPVTGQGMEEMESRLTPVPNSVVVLVIGK